MSSKSKTVGTRAETKVRRYFETNGLRCERKALAGSNDEGDLRLYTPDGLEITIEVKAGEQTASYGRKLLDKWKRQTLDEAENSGCLAILIVVRHRRKFVDAEVWMPNTTGDKKLMSFWTMTYINDFVDVIKGSE